MRYILLTDRFKGKGAIPLSTLNDLDEVMTRYTANAFAVWYIRDYNDYV
jgi:hypothetical protein